MVALTEENTVSSTDKDGIKVVFENQPSLEFDSLELDVETSSKLFKRSGEVNQIIVSIKEN